MKKSAMLLSGVLVFATAMLAQDTQSSSGSSSQYPSGSSQSGSSQAGSGSTSQSGSDTSQSGSSGSMGSQSGSSGSMSGQTGSSGSQTGSMSSGQTSADQVEGCIYREATDYYIYPTRGNQMKVSGQDVSAHLGHHVKLHGNKQAGSPTASTGGTTGSAAGEASSAASGQSAGQGSMAGSTGTHGSASAGNEFMVESVDMVSASCPSKIRKKIESRGGSLGSGDTGSTSGTTSNPPKQ